MDSAQTRPAYIRLQHYVGSKKKTVTCDQKGKKRSETSEMEYLPLVKEVRHDRIAHAKP